MPLSLLRLSSLDLVRGFVAVGRRMSISLAAEDLCLTQSAVSKQIHALEEQLGVKLLVRGHRSISFTAEGERLFRSADGAVQQLQDVMGGIRQAGEQRPVTLSASIGMTGLWLLPRLSRVQKLHPGVDVRVSANNRLADLRNEGIDLAIRYTTPALAPAGALRLFGETVALVAHPSLGLKTLRAAGAVSRLCLLDFDDPQHPWLQWNGWLASVGWADAKPQAVLHFNQYDQLIQAALAGQGVALGRLELVQPLLDEKRLVRVDSPVPAQASGHAYWLIQAEDAPREEVRHVAAWLVAEAQQSRDAVDTGTGP
ncbi:DNA-binding transcriptional LysR family regulator [Variovorax boronicumulans]|uniref:LysR substrate-binding domain-containing protein n=1 Tax=Variovorax boronicumulans TaxID=436515 RepID=UPI00277D22B1|nr:LysR substrate-binding domain-containing protein [Variovorax boronicumulans]MDQ0033049.1 DNA-binding transcriptional LysR family regulator [Variovorax boronicumulans]